MTASIKLRGASLAVPMYLQPERHAGSWRSLFLGAVMDPPRRQFATLLDNIDIDVKAGERLGILGRNGAGKSTLLKLLNGVYAPTSGVVDIRGSRSAMLNIALGFIGEATVRENIFLRGTAMGMDARYLRSQIIPILEFSGLLEKANHRFHTLSTGQKMRLGFSVSTCVRHDVIMMDEWVGSGDGIFFAQAKERLLGQMSEESIVVLASHSSGLLRSLCTRGIVLEQGRMIYSGDIAAALKYYHEHLAALRERSVQGLPGDMDAGAQNIYGCVETLVLEMGKLHLQGWLASTDGPAPRYLVLELDGASFDMQSVERYDRPDVVKHLGLSEDQCGFRATFAVPKLKSMAELATGVQVFGGTNAEHASSPLRLAPAVLSTLKQAKTGQL